MELVRNIAEDPFCYTYAYFRSEDFQPDDSASKYGIYGFHGQYISQYIIELCLKRGYKISNHRQEMTGWSFDCELDDSVHNVLFECIAENGTNYWKVVVNPIDTSMSIVQLKSLDSLNQFLCQLSAMLHFDARFHDIWWNRQPLNSVDSLARFK